MPEIVIARTVTKIVSSDEFFFMLRAGCDRSTCKTVFVNDALWLRSSNSHMPLLLIRPRSSYSHTLHILIRTRSLLIRTRRTSYSHRLVLLIRTGSYYLIRTSSYFLFAHSPNS